MPSLGPSVQTVQRRMQAKPEEGPTDLLQFPDEWRGAALNSFSLASMIWFMV